MNDPDEQLREWTQEILKEMEGNEDVRGRERDARTSWRNEAINNDELMGILEKSIIFFCAILYGSSHLFRHLLYLETSGIKFFSTANCGGCLSIFSWTTI